MKMQIVKKWDIGFTNNSFIILITVNDVYLVTKYIDGDWYIINHWQNNGKQQ
jgi:hypothetical protein